MKQPSKRALVYTAIVQLQRLADLFKQRRGRLARRVGLTEQEWRVFEEISTEHFIPSLFARDQDMSLPAVSNVIRQLSDKKVLRVSPNYSDGRKRRYVLTANGERKANKLRTLRERAIDKTWMLLDATSLEKFNKIATQLIDLIETYDKKE
jgi:DNA-binding MarR family transcriptional regulator